MFNKQRFRLIDTAAAVSCVLGLVSVASPAAASTDHNGSGTAAQACTSWQYVVKSRGTIRHSPGGSETGVTAQPGDLVNVHEFSGYWYKVTSTGNLAVTTPTAGS